MDKVALNNKIRNIQIRGILEIIYINMIVNILMKTNY